jgi:hypothetical protein
MVTVVACLLGGIALGLRFKVFILIPAVTVATFFVSIGAIVANDSIWSTLLTLVEILPAIQAGYLMGISGADVAAKMLGRRQLHLCHGYRTKRIRFAIHRRASCHSLT